jgi:CRISPR system Cascade subunit CasC
VRSRLTFERYVVQPLVSEGLDENLVRAVTEAFMTEVLGESKKAKAKKKEEEEEGEQSQALETGQITVFGRPELTFIANQVREVCSAETDPKKVKKAVKSHMGGEVRRNLKEMRLGAGLGAALFGRMVTSDVLARVDAAVHVAHAFTVHAEHAETDYFSAIDDLRQTEGGELGSGHINSTELTSGLYYGYVAVDLPLLVSNLDGCAREQYENADRRLSADVVARLVKLVATVSPGAKLGSTAPYAFAHLVIIETGRTQPRTLANAFLEPVPERGGILTNTHDALAGHLEALDRMYGATTERRFAALESSERLRSILGAPAPLDDVSGWVKDQLLSGGNERS